MAHPQNVSKNSKNNNFYSLAKGSCMKMKKNAFVRLKYIHNRILDHIKMKHFLENHEVDSFLNQLKKLISNQDEIEAFRKKLKYMLLTIKDSIVEFEEAISSGEVTFPSGKMSENSHITKKDTSQSSSGVSTTSEISSLSHLILTNNNFQTIPNNSTLDLIQSKSPDSRYNIAQYDEKSSSNNSNLAPSSVLKNKNSNSFTNSYHMNKLRNKKGDNTYNLLLQANSNSLQKKKMVKANTKEICSSYNTENVSPNDSSIPLSALELTNNNFQTLKNCTSRTNCNIPSVDNSKNSLDEEVITQDLFTPPIPVERNIIFKNPCHNNKNEKINKQKKISNFFSKGIGHYKSKYFLPGTLNIGFEMEDNDYIEHLQKLNLGTTNNKINESLPLSQSFGKNEEKNSTVELIVSSPKEKCSSLSLKNDVILMSDDSETSEIYFLDNLSTIRNVENKKENNIPVMKNRSHEIMAESKWRKTRCSHEDFSGKQSVIVSTQVNEISKMCSSKNPQHINCKQEIKSKKCTEILSDNQYYSSDHFSQMIHSPDMCTPFTYYSNNNSKGIKRRCMDLSPNLEMINRKIIFETIDNCKLVKSYPTESADTSSHISADARIQCNRNISDLDKELEEAKAECARTLKDLTNLLSETKKELMRSKNTSITGYCNGKLKFPPGYEHHYKQLDDLLLEFKKNIGIPSNIYQVEDQDVFFEETMNTWEELQQIVQKIKDREKRQ